MLVYVVGTVRVLAAVNLNANASARVFRLPHIDDLHNPTTTTLAYQLRTKHHRTQTSPSALLFLTLAHLAHEAGGAGEEDRLLIVEAYNVHGWMQIECNRATRRQRRPAKGFVKMARILGSDVVIKALL